MTTADVTVEQPGRDDILNPKVKRYRVTCPSCRCRFTYGAGYITSGTTSGTPTVKCPEFKCGLEIHHNEQNLIVTR